MLKPFNLERALAGDEVVTRDGRKVLDFKYWKDIIFIEALIQSPNNYKNISGYNLEGKFFKYGEESPCDLFMASKIREYWSNVCKKQNGSIYLCGLYITEEEAKTAKEYNSGYLKTISFEVEK